MTTERCPHCNALGSRIEDDRSLKGVVISTPYCGLCGRNWTAPVQPTHKPKPTKHALASVGELARDWQKTRSASR